MAYQKFPTSKQLIQELKSKKLEKIYLFLGEEEGEKEKIIDQVIDVTLSNEEKEYSARRFHLENDELSQAVEFSISGSMFSERKVSILLNINSLKSNAGSRELMGEMLCRMPDSNILIITSPENKIPAIIESKYLKDIKIFQFWRYFENDILTYIISMAKRKGMGIERDAASHLLELTGRDIKKIDEAMELLTGSGEKILNNSIIKEYLYDNKDVSIFEFIDSLFRKDKNTFYQFAKLLDSGIHQLVLLKLITKQAELIEKYHHLNRSFNSEEAMQKIGIDPRRKKSFLECSKIFDPLCIKRIFLLIFKADQRIKSYNYSNNLASDPVFELVTDMIFESSIN